MDERKFRSIVVDHNEDHHDCIGDSCYILNYQRQEEVPCKGDEVGRRAWCR